MEWQRTRAEALRAARAACTATALMVWVPCLSLSLIGAGATCIAGLCGVHMRLVKAHQDRLWIASQDAAQKAMDDWVASLSSLDAGEGGPWPASGQRQAVARPDPPRVSYDVGSDRSLAVHADPHTLRVVCGLSLFTSLCFPLLSIISWYAVESVLRSASRRGANLGTSVDTRDGSWSWFANRFVGAGVPLATLDVRLVLASSWVLQVVHRPRAPLWAPLAQLLVPCINVLSFMVAADSGDEVGGAVIGPLWLAIVAYAAITAVLGTRFLLHEYRHPRYAVLVSPSALSRVQDHHGTARAALAHEASHMRHRDPVLRSMAGTVVCVTLLGSLAVPLAAFASYSVVSNPAPWVLGGVGILLSLVVGAWSWFAGPAMHECRADLEAAGSDEDRAALVGVLSGFARPTRGDRARLRALSGDGGLASLRWSVVCWATLALLAVGLSLASLGAAYETIRASWGTLCVG